MTDQLLIEGIQLSKQAKNIYGQLVGQKHDFIHENKEIFSDITKCTYSIEEYARELLLEPSECSESHYLLPPL